MIKTTFFILVASLVLGLNACSAQNGELYTLALAILPREVPEFLVVRGLEPEYAQNAIARLQLEFAQGLEGAVADFAKEGITQYIVPRDGNKSVTLGFEDYLLPGEMDLEGVQLFKLEPPELDRALRSLQRQFPNPDERLRAIAKMYVGADYYHDPLIDELTEWLPYKKTNCTMFVLYATAFLNSGSYEEALYNMKHLHYRGGDVGFLNRYHFTSDRISDPNNIYFTDLTEQAVLDPATLFEVTVTLNVKADGAHLFQGRLNGWERTVTMKYLPRQGFSPEQLKDLPGPVGVAFVQKSNWEQGVIVGHEGILIDGDLYHASSPSVGLIVEKDYLRASFATSTWEGLILFSLNDVSTH